MDGSHPKKVDPRPKRRKAKDNPYEIFTTGIETADPHYFLSFIDGDGVTRCLEINRAVFDAFDHFELDDISYMHKMDRHYEQSEQTEESINKRAVQPQDPVEETVSRQIEIEALHQAIARLPETQRRRLVLYYFGELTYQQIAAMEGCKHPAVVKSISSALKKLKKYLSGEVTI